MLVETLGALAVIGLLAAVSATVFSGGADRAKSEQAERELLRLAEAELTLAREFGHFVPLQLLDDLPVREGRRTALTDDIGNEPADAVHLIDPRRPIDEQVGRQATLGSSEARRTIDNWPGPLFEPKRIFYGGYDPVWSPTQIAERGVEIGAAVVRRDYPLDPWGRPYRFYSPIGLIGSTASQSDPGALFSDAFSDGKLTNVDDRFDAFAIVSFGPDGVSDATQGVEIPTDDVIFFLTLTEETDGP